MAGFIFDTRAALSEIQDWTPATVATTATKPVVKPEMSQLSQLSQPLTAEMADPDLGAFDERSAIIHEAHTITIADDGAPLPEPIFTLTRHDTEKLAAQKQGFNDGPSLQGEMVRRWAAEIARMARLPTISAEGAVALKSARAFISDGWAFQAARLGWDESELFGVCPSKPCARLDRKGVAFGGAVQAVTEACVVYVSGPRRYRAQVNNDNGAVLIWELTQDSGPTNGGDAA